MSILTRKRDFWQQIQSCIPSKHIHLFRFGFETLVGTEIRSTRANARRSHHLWSTAKGKMWRLLRNGRIAAHFPRLLTMLGLVAPYDVIAVDFSDFKDGRQVLMFAKQTNQGRAMPVYFEILEYPIEQDSQNIFVIDAIERFTRCVGTQPLLVFDRGFACPAIVRYLLKNKHRFIIRIKKRKHVSYAGVRGAVEDMQIIDAMVRAYEHKIRLIVSDPPRNGNDPWYLITNDRHAPRTMLIEWYYHRFEIEEFFRDAKHVLRLEWVRCKTTQSLSVILWFSLITCWLFVCISATLTSEERTERARWQVSVFRYVLEKLDHEIRRLADPPHYRAMIGG